MDRGHQELQSSAQEMGLIKPHILKTSSRFPCHRLDGRWDRASEKVGEASTMPMSGLLSPVVAITLGYMLLQPQLAQPVISLRRYA